MPEINTPNLALAFQQGQEFGTKQRLQREGEQRRNQLNQLAQTAYTDPTQRQAAIGQAVGLDAESGLALGKQFQEQERDEVKQAGNVASHLLGAFERNNPAEIQGAYRAVRPYFERIAPPGTVLPDTVDDSIKPMLYQLQAVAAGTTGGQDELKSLRIGENGNYWAIRGNQLVDTGVRAAPDNQLIEGQGGYFGVNRRTLGAAPVSVGGAPPVMPQAGGVQFQIDPSIPAPVANALAQQEAQAGGTQRPWTANTPDIVGGGQMAPSGQLQAPSKDAPAGYQFNSSGGLEPIPGGPADKPALTPADIAKDEQAFRKEVSARIAEPRTVLTAYEKVRNSANNPSAANDLALIFSYMKMLDPGSVVREGEFANAQNATGVDDRILNTYNKLLSGERLNPNQRQQFVQSANVIADQARSQITNVAREYQATAEAYGYDPQRATGLADFRGVSGSTGEGQSGERQPAFPTTDEQYNALPSGALFVDPDDGKTYRKP